MKKPPAAAAPVPQVTQATPLENRLTDWGLLVKREDLACAPPGPASGRMRGVYAHAARLVKQGAAALGVLDGGSHQHGLAVAYVARLLQVPCVIYHPKVDKPTPTHVKAGELGAELVELAGDPAFLFAQHQAATADIRSRAGVLMPPGLKLAETTEEVAAEVVRTFEQATREEFEVMRSWPWLVSLGSAAVAKGVVVGLARVLGPATPHVLVHLPQERAFGGLDLTELCRLSPSVRLADELYAPGEAARPGPDPLWSVDDTDLKALRWWARFGRDHYGQATFWSVG